VSSDRFAAPRPGGERAQATPLAVALVFLAGVLLVVLVPLGRGAIERAQARTAADAAALAGAAEGEAAARAVAHANGARLVRFAALDRDVWVVVERGGAVAEARARREPVP
jgi:uncharacterized membrane protein